MANDIEQLVLSISADTKQMQRALAKLTTDTAKTTKTIETRFETMSRSVERSVGRIGAGLKNFGAGLLAGAGLASVEGLARSLRSAVKEAADLVDLSEKVGVNTDDIQKMIFGFNQAGVEAETVTKSLSQWGRRIGEAYTQGGPLAELFKANNLSLTDGEGRLRSSVDLLGDMANLIKNAGSEQERLALAQIAFGKAGDDMVLALKDGAAGMRDLMRLTDDAGGVLDREVLKRAAELDDRFDKLSRQVELGLKEGMLAVADAVVAVLDAATALGNKLVEISNIPAPTWLRILDGVAGGAIPTGLPSGGISKIGEIAATMRDRVGKGEFGDAINNRIDSAFSDPTKPNRSLQQLLRDRFSPKSTIIPNFGGGGGGSNRRSSVEKEDPWEGLRESARDYGKELEEIQRQQEEIGDSVGNFVGRLVNAFKDGKLEAQELLSIVADLAVQLLQMPSIGGGGFGGGFLSSLLGSIFHQGGVVGQGGPTRAVSPLAFAGAPRMHSGGIAGLRSGEVPAILQRGEIVLPRGSKMGGSQSVVINAPINAPGADAAQLRRVEESVKELGRNVPKMVDARNKTAQSRKTRA